MAMAMEALVRTTAWIVASMSYARFASSLIRPGNLRLLALLPVIILFPYLPWHFTSICLRAISAFFLAWLGVLKLLLLAFGAGPLHPSLPLATFIAISSLPVRIRTEKEAALSNKSSHSFLPTCIKLAIFALMTPIYQYKSRIDSWMLLAVYCVYIYLFLELILASAALLAGSLLGLGIEPQSVAPFKSASLQDFWGRRWNLMVSGILRPTVYCPVRSRFGTSAAFMAVFVASGLMHEVVLYYVTLQGPTGEVTLFFVIHGLCTAAEVKAKKAGLWRPLHPAVAVPMTLGFVIGTAFWLFLPTLVRARADEKGMEECAEVLRVVEDRFRAVLRWLSS